MADKIKGIPTNTIRRLPKYFHYMKEMERVGEQYITSDQLSQYFGIHSTQVRKDLHTAGLTGKPKVGHDLSEAIPIIQDFLGWNNPTDAFLIGTGNLGNAILKYQGFDQTGVKIIAAFDIDSNKTGQSVNGIPIYPMNKLTNLALRMHVKIGILTCSPEAAQNVANELVVCGIKAIWNFTTTRLYVPEGIITEQTELFSSLAILSRKLAESPS